MNYLQFSSQLSTHTVERLNNTICNMITWYYMHCIAACQWQAQDSDQTMNSRETLLTVTHFYGVSVCAYFWQKLYYEEIWLQGWFLAVTKQLYEWFSPSARPSACLPVCPPVRPSVRPSVTPFSLCSHHCIIMKFIIMLLPMTEVMFIQKVKVRGQRSMSQRSWPHFAVFGP